MRGTVIFVTSAVGVVQVDVFIVGVALVTLRGEPFLVAVFTRLWVGPVLASISVLSLLLLAPGLFGIGGPVVVHLVLAIVTEVVLVVGVYLWCTRAAAGGQYVPVVTVRSKT